MSGSVPSVSFVITTLAGITLRRLSRGRAIWVAVAIALLPVLLAVSKIPWSMTDVFTLSLTSMTVLAPMFIGTSLGDEIEERTTTYLWSRPMPRWTVLAGKLAAIVPMIALFAAGGWILANLARGTGMPPVMSVVAIVLGAFGISMIATALATVAPKHGMAIAIMYLVFFDLPLGAMPFKLKVLSMTYQLSVVSGEFPANPSATSGLLWALGLSVAFGGLSAWRISKLES